MALIAMRQDIKTELSKKYPNRERCLFTSIDTVALDNSVPPSFCLAFQRLRQGFPRIQDSIETTARQPDLNGHLASTEYMPGKGIPDTGLKLKNTLEVDFKEDGKIHTTLPSLKLTKQDINRWKMAKRAAESIDEISDDKIFSGNAFERRCTNMPSLRVVFNNLPLLLGCSAVPMVYGGLHALAWFAHFHSPTEQLLWRISSVVVIGGIPTFVAIWKLADSFSADHAVVALTFFVLDFLIAIPYVLARLYLVVECFIQLSHLPAGVYEESHWSAYFPHIA